MSVSASFWKFSKRKNSTKQPTGTGTQYSVDLKSGTSLISPTLLLNNSGKPDYNYFQFEGMYYFVTDIVSVRNDLWEIYGRVDALATAKTAILNSTQFVSYSSYKTSDWLADTRIPLQQNTLTSVSTSLTGILSTIGTYVLTVVGENGCATYTTTSTGDLSQLLADISTWETTEIQNAINKIDTITPSVSPVSPTYASSGDDNPECFNALIATVADAFDKAKSAAQNIQISMNKVLSTVEEAAVQQGFVGNAYANAPQCIRSCIWVPFDYALAPSGSGSSPVMLGRFATSVNMIPTSSTPVTGSNTITIPWHYSDWRRAICEDVYLYLPLVGMVQLSGDSLTHVSSLTIDWSATYTDGVITYKVKAGSEVIGSYGAQCSANYPLGIAQQASAGEVFNALVGGVEKTVSSLVNSSISPLSMAGSVVSAGANAAITAYDVENIKKSTHISCIGGVGGGAGIGLGRDCVCYTVAHPTVVNPSDMVATMGYPTMKPMSLSTLTGYCECANGHVEADFPSPILQEVDILINSGFFIE